MRREDDLEGRSVSIPTSVSWVTEGGVDKTRVIWESHIFHPYLATACSSNPGLMAENRLSQRPSHVSNNRREEVDDYPQ